MVSLLNHCKIKNISPKTDVSLYTPSAAGEEEKSTLFLRSRKLKTFSGFHFF